MCVSYHSPRFDIQSKNESATEPEYSVFLWNLPPLCVFGVTQKKLNWATTIISSNYTDRFLTPVSADLRTAATASPQPSIHRKSIDSKKKNEMRHQHWNPNEHFLHFRCRESSAHSRPFVFNSISCAHLAPSNKIERPKTQPQENKIECGECLSAPPANSQKNVGPNKNWLKYKWNENNLFLFNSFIAVSTVVVVAVVGPALLYLLAVIIITINMHISIKI